MECGPASVQKIVVHYLWEEMYCTVKRAQNSPFHVFRWENAPARLLSGKKDAFRHGVAITSSVRQIYFQNDKIIVNQQHLDSLRRWTVSVVTHVHVAFKLVNLLSPSMPS